MSQNGHAELVTVTIDGKQIRVAKGTNIIEAAKSIGITIPHYCYHPHLSIAGNCRMCQVKVKGAPKLDIACNMLVREGMEVQTQLSSPEVADAQAAVLEFILINHPLDCTVCDQSGHCKLQDYHFEYNARSSRFLEDKVHKVKAEPLGPNVILDGERCIMCTRCIRFCDEVTGTSELGMLERGDKSVIAIKNGKELNNPLSGTVCDLCPVGALTHRPWRFNTRIWYTKETDSICTGCSTGCNVKVAERDKQVVQVKARMNAEVNKEWLCDEGRYGFNRFLPEQRVTKNYIGDSVATFEQAIAKSKGLSSSEALILLAPDLLLEEYYLIKNLIDKHLKNATVALAYKGRELSSVEAILISPDYAPNFKAAELLGLVSGDLEANYSQALSKLNSGAFKNVLLLGEQSISKENLTPETLRALTSAFSVGVFMDASSKLNGALQVSFAGRSILEKSGLMLNRKGRLQYSQAVVEFPQGTEPEWRVINRLAKEMGSTLTNALADRELTLWFLSSEWAKQQGLAGISIAKIKAGGICLNTYKADQSKTTSAEQTGAAV